MLGQKEISNIGEYFDIEIDENSDSFVRLDLIDKKSADKKIKCIWLSLPIQKGKNNNEILKNIKSCIDSFIPWLELLKDFDKPNRVNQSLFGEDSIEEETLPEPPTFENGENWKFFHKEEKRVKLSNIKKQYSFFELFEPSHDSWYYSGNDYRKFLPTEEEALEMYKKTILDCLANDNKYEDGGYFDEYNWIGRDSALTDYELFQRVKSITRTDLVPYKSFKHYSYDLSFSMCSFAEETKFRYSIRGGRLVANGIHDEDKIILPKYDFYKPEFITWLRKVFKVSKKNSATDDEVLKNAIVSFLNSMLWYGKDKYNWIERIKVFKNYKVFKKDFLTFLKEENIDSNGGSSLGADDGYSGWINRDKNGSIKITQNTEYRSSLNREIKINESDSRDSLVFHIVDNEIYEKAFEFFGGTEIKVRQTSLFNFI